MSSGLLGTIFSEVGWMSHPTTWWTWLGTLATPTTSKILVLLPLQRLVVATATITTTSSNCNTSTNITNKRTNNNNSNTTHPQLFKPCFLTRETPPWSGTSHPPRTREWRPTSRRAPPPSLIGLTSVSWRPTRTPPMISPQARRSSSTPPPPPPPTTAASMEPCYLPR